MIVSIFYALKMTQLLKEHVINLGKLNHANHKMKGLENVLSGLRTKQVSQDKTPLL